MKKRKRFYTLTFIRLSIILWWLSGFLIFIKLKFEKFDIINCPILFIFDINFYERLFILFDWIKLFSFFSFRLFGFKTVEEKANIVKNLNWNGLFSFLNYSAAKRIRFFKKCILTFNNVMKYIYIYSFINSLILIIHTRKNNLISSCIINIKRNLSSLIPFLAHSVNNETYSYSYSPNSMRWIYYASLKDSHYRRLTLSHRCLKVKNKNTILSGYFQSIFVWRIDFYHFIEIFQIDNRT